MQWLIIGQVPRPSPPLLHRQFRLTSIARGRSRKTVPLSGVNNSKNVVAVKAIYKVTFQRRERWVTYTFKHSSVGGFSVILGGEDEV